MRKSKLLKKELYDRLFYLEKDPVAANLTLLVFEIERFCTRMGEKPVFGNFSTSGKKLDDFITRNLPVLSNLFLKRFPEPKAYSFGEFTQKALNKFYKFYVGGQP